MEISEFISSMPVERQKTLISIHELILANDPSVIPVIKLMMGKETILYEQRSVMKYGLASAKGHMTLHCLPMYIDPSLHAKFINQFPDAKFQKGCINFENSDEMPIEVLTALIIDCATINIAEVLENRKKKKK
jgi:hypothetical protein